MELFRYTRDMYGQETLQGISWDLLPIFAGVSAVIIAIHYAFCAFMSAKKK